MKKFNPRFIYDLIFQARLTTPISPIQTTTGPVSFALACP